MLSEFDMIQRFFAPLSVAKPNISIGIGDDAAVVKIKSRHELVVSTDTLIAGVHFFKGADPKHIAHKALVSNLSDLAAMGAKPLWYTLALTLPQAEEDWLIRFSQGLKEYAEHFDVVLVGGDTTQGPTLVITITVMGTVPQGKAITRSGAKPGDSIFVTGTLGDAGYALHGNQNYQATPRLKAGMSLQTIASAMIDISDGFSADLNHILEASQVGATVELAHIPLSKPLIQALPQKQALALALSAGDDYELCFTVPEKNLSKLEKNSPQLDCCYTRVGYIEAKPGLRAVDPDGKICDLNIQGFKHFNGRSHLR